MKRHRPSLAKLGATDEQHCDGAEVRADRVELGITALRRALAEGDLRRATRLALDLASNAGSAHTHQVSAGVRCGNVRELVSQATDLLEEFKKQVDRRRPEAESRAFAHFGVPR